MEWTEIIICCRAGGVGKTTLSAALGLSGAMAGKKTVVLTIDPAKRLADALGLKGFTADAQPVPLENFNVPGAFITQASGLYAMMLDPKTTFDQLVAQYASSDFQEKFSVTAITSTVRQYGRFPRVHGHGKAL
ncbi:MAG: ArsA-related P-loop ATPase [Desulfobacterales bacterium]